MSEITEMDDAIVQSVARRVRLARTAAGISQQAIAERCGITFQQWQKYERADNRIPVEKLVRLAAATGRDIGWFFEDAMAGGSTDAADLVEKLVTDREFAELARAWRELLPPARTTATQTVQLLAGLTAAIEARQQQGRAA